LTNNPICAIIKVQKRDNLNKNFKEIIAMTTYTVLFSTKTASFGGHYTAPNALTACVKAVAQFHHLGARLNNIVEVTAK
jgi:hypothetical protein